MNYAVEMGSGAMIYIPSFIKIGLGIQKLMEGRRINIQTHSLLLFLQTKESRLIMLIFLLLLLLFLMTAINKDANILSSYAI
jgi:di/tricarboxylate transporter